MIYPNCVGVQARIYSPEQCEGDNIDANVQANSSTDGTQGKTVAHAATNTKTEQVQAAKVWRQLRSSRIMQRLAGSNIP